MSALAVSPALAPGKAAPYVIAAYAVFLAIVLIYVAIMARRLTKTERDLAELKREVEGSAEIEVSQQGAEAQGAEPAGERGWRRDPEIVS
jgi:type II secretory pathway component PulM